MPLFKLRGDIDCSNAAAVDTELRTLLAEHESGNLVVDCSELQFIDSSGIRVLIGVASELAADDRATLTINVPPRCARALEICGVTEILGMHVPVPD